MKERYFHTGLLIRVQRWSWFLFLILFSAAIVLNMLKIEIAEQLTFWAIVLILTMAVVIVIIIAEQFRRVGLYRCAIIGYTMILISLCTLLLKLYLTV